MLRIIIIAPCLVLLAATTAFAQQQPAPPPYVPFEISQDDYTKIMTYLGEQPAKIAIPLMQALQAMEQKAVAEKAKASVPPATPKD